MTEYVIARTEKWDFSPPIEESDPDKHTVLMIENGVLQWCERNSIFNQVDWPTWFRHGGKFAQPEGGDIWAHKYPERVLCGTKAEKLFWFWRAGEGGQLHQMAVEPCQRITFTAQVQGWSSDDDDGRTSTGVGRRGSLANRRLAPLCVRGSICILVWARSLSLRYGDFLCSALKLAIFTKVWYNRV